MPHVIAEVNPEFLQAFADSWNHRDLDALMAFVTEDCVFEASAGPDVCFRDGKIAVKDPYRKNRPPLGTAKR